MLILSCRVGQVVKIGDEITVAVLDAKGNLARIGVGAPKEMAIHREEVIARAQKASAPAKSTIVGLGLSRSRGRSQRRG